MVLRFSLMTAIRIVGLRTRRLRRPAIRSVVAIDADYRTLAARWLYPTVAWAPRTTL